MATFKSYKQTSGPEVIIDIEQVEYVTKGPDNCSIFFMKSGARIPVISPYEETVESLAGKKVLTETTKKKKWRI